MKTLSRSVLGLIVFISFLVALSACSPAPKETGILEGRVTIGPLVPVVREGEPEPTPAPEVYAAREIVIFNQNGKTEVVHITIEPDGTYQAELPVGIYVVDINHGGIDRAEGLPQEISIKPDSVTRLDIDIDTGIR
jgi:hypothetical protein